MKKRLEQKDLIKYLNDLLEVEALELIKCPEINDEDIFIPYMMNDAVEFYLILKNCKIFGEQYKDFTYETKAEAIENKEKKGIVLRMKDRKFVTIWYNEAYSEKKLYQYHGIGHFWRKGQEQWRQLVYAIGTGYDKAEYLGQESCNEIEKELIPLMNFAPFRYWTPLKEDLDDRYIDQSNGIDTMIHFCKAAKDFDYLRKVNIYKLLYRIPIVSKKFLQKRMAVELLTKKRIKLYKVIYDKLEQASKLYDSRIYSFEIHKEMEEQRNKVEKILKYKGYSGLYPLFYKNHQCVVAMEEHPFIIQSMDYDDFYFNIQFMVSESDNDTINAGFFEGNGKVYKSIKDFAEI